MDWFKGKFTGKPHIWWENPWFPVDFPLNQSIDCCFVHTFPRFHVEPPALPRTAIWTPIGLNPWTASWTTVACWPCLPMKEFLWSFTWRWSLKLGTEIVGHKSGVITCDNRMDSPSNSGNYQLVDSSLVDFLGLNIPRYMPPYNEVLATLAIHLPSIPTSENPERVGPRRFVISIMRHLPLPPELALCILAGTAGTNRYESHRIAMQYFCRDCTEVLPSVYLTLTWQSTRHHLDPSGMEFHLEIPSKSIVSRCFVGSLAGISSWPT